MCHNSELAQSIYRVAQRHVFAYVRRHRRYVYSLSSVGSFECDQCSYYRLLGSSEEVKRWHTRRRLTSNANRRGDCSGADCDDNDDDENP